MARPRPGGPSLPSATAPTAPSWADLFLNASPAQQQELLSLAHRQGLLYEHQLPAANGHATVERARPLLARLLAGHTADLESLRLKPITVTDSSLDDCQREAVARAVHTPDVCLIQGLPGTGKSRVAAEIITQATARGERVLLIAPSPEPVDRVLETLAEREGPCPVRCLARTEALESLPPASRSFTVVERLRQLHEQTLPRAHAEAEAASETCTRLRLDETRWEQLRELAAHQDRLTAEHQALEAARQRLDDEMAAAAIRAEAGGLDEAGNTAAFATGLRDCSRRREEEVARLAEIGGKVEEKLAGYVEEENTLLANLEELRPLAEALERARWWTGAWWRAVFRGKVPDQAAGLRERLQQVRADRQPLEEQKQRVLAEKEELSVRFGAERARLLAAETTRRRADIDAREAATLNEQHLSQARWQTVCQELQAETPRPAACTAAAVSAACEAWRALLGQADEHAAFARQWAACLHDLAEEFPRRLRELCNVVAATTTGLATDEHFRDAVGPPFDLLVLESADQITEADFLTLARRARRWVLIGQPPLTSVHAAPDHKPAPQRGARPTALCAAFFHRLWHYLHCDPRRLPYAWVQEKEGLCCRLRSVLPEQSQWLEKERVADFPDIELRILAMPRSEPLLAEVVFPSSMSIGQAKEYIFRELQVLPIRAQGHSLRWIEEAEHVVLGLTDTPAPGGVAIALEAGVREMLHGPQAESNGHAPPPSPWHTCCVEFERGAGWHRERAEAWVEQHLGLRDLGRTVWLDIPYRMHPDLATFLSDLLFDGEYRLSCKRGHEELPAFRGADGKATPVIEFVPVPSLREQARSPAAAGVSGQRAVQGHGGQRTSAPTATLSRRGGAGLELDLADFRHRDRLPSEFRAALPNAGLVNYLEAQAIVHVLENLVADPAVHHAAAANKGNTCPTLAVMALYPTQVDLIRRLVAQSPALLASAVGVEIDVPAAFRERECLVALVSLTRSHTHRAVSFGEGPHQLAQALTRARARVILFGDPGTLARRSQWENPLDHLDEPTSARERALIAELVSYIQGQGPHPHAFQVREGSHT